MPVSLADVEAVSAWQLQTPALSDAQVTELYIPTCISACPHCAQVVPPVRQALG